jgi:hypothetical protein
MVNVTNQEQLME